MARLGPMEAGRRGEPFDLPEPGTLEGYAAVRFKAELRVPDRTPEQAERDKQEAAERQRFMALAIQHPQQIGSRDLRDGDMKRFLIFPLVGPLFGTAVFDLLMWVKSSDFSWWDPEILIFGYIAGFVPALLTGIFDWLLSTRLSRWWRVLATSCAGFALSTLMFRWYTYPEYPLTAVLLLGSFGIIPAAVCSWLSNYQPKESRNA